MQKGYVEISVFCVFEADEKTNPGCSSESQMRLLFLWETPRLVKYIKRSVELNFFVLLYRTFSEQLNK